MNQKTTNYLNQWAAAVHQQVEYFIELGDEIYTGMEGVGESDVIAYYVQEIIATILDYCKMHNR
jgi:hypothetical protein